LIPKIFGIYNMFMGRKQENENLVGTVSSDRVDEGRQ
jgi:hypothetical protein